MLKLKLYSKDKIYGVDMRAASLLRHSAGIIRMTTQRAERVKWKDEIDYDYTLGIYTHRVTLVRSKCHERRAVRS